MNIINEAMKNKSLFYKRDILPLLLSLSVIDLFMTFVNVLNALILRVVYTIPYFWTLKG